jgi:hypothetical protein
LASKEWRLSLSFGHGRSFEYAKGLTLTFNKPVRDKTFDKLIWLLDAATVLYTGYLLFVA